MINLKKIQLEPRQELLLGATAFAVVLVLLVRFIYVPIFGEISERRAALTDVRVKVNDAQMLAGELGVYEENLRQAQASYEAIERRVGEGQSVARILETLSAQAEKHKLELGAVKTREEDAEELQAVISVSPEMNLHAVPLTLRLTGRYPQIGEFLGELDEVPFVSSVDELTLTNPEDGGMALEAKLVLAIYLRREPAE